MPASAHEGKVWIEQVLTSIKTHKDATNQEFGDVLDVGVGQGTYSDLFRSRFGKRWIGIEIHEPYVEKFDLKKKYKPLYVADVRNFEKHPEKSFTVGILGDVLEHLSYTDAIDVYLKMLACCEYVIISIPIIPYPQGEVDGNIHEAHLETWDHEKVLKAFPAIKTWYQGNIVGCYLATNYWEKYNLKPGRVPKIGVYCITKNEEKFVDRMIESCLDADYIAITDTGSTDGTVERIQAWVDKLPGKVMLQTVHIKPFRFDWARNASLSFLPVDCDLAICLDLDEVMEAGWRNFFNSHWMPWNTRCHYPFIWNWNTDGTPRTTYMADKIHSRHGYMWVNPVHETLTPYGLDNGEDHVTTHSFKFLHYADNNKPRSNYLPLLELSVRENPHNDRNCHYLAREYFNYKMYPQAAREFQRHIKDFPHAWAPERAKSMRLLGQSFAAMKQDALAEVSFFQSITLCPEMREPWLDLARYFQQRDRFTECLVILNRALQIPASAIPHSYIVDHEYYRELPYDLMSVCYFWLAKNEAGTKRREYLDLALENAKKALEYEPNDPRLLANLSFTEIELAK